MVAFGIEWQIYYVTLLMDIFYGLEIVMNFFTSYADDESFAEEYSLKKIALNYVKNGNFASSMISTIPFGIIWGSNNSDHHLKVADFNF